MRPALIYSGPQLSNCLHACTSHSTHYGLAHIAPRKKSSYIHCHAIRKAAISDLPALTAIEEACGSWTAAQVAEELDREMATALVDERDEDIAGWIVAWNVPPDELQILEIAVCPSHRRQGVATALLSHLLTEHRHGALIAMLEVRASNTGAISLYEKAGFISVGKRPRFYSDNEDAVLMNYQLPSIDS